MNSYEAYSAMALQQHFPLLDGANGLETLSTCLAEEHHLRGIYTSDPSPGTGIAPSAILQAIEHIDWQPTGSEPLLDCLDRVETEFFADARKRRDTKQPPHILEGPGTKPASEAERSLHSPEDEHSQIRPTRTRFSQEALQALNLWLSSHEEDPYPSKADVAQLSVETGLSVRQVKTWFMNSRRRFAPQRINRTMFGHASSTCTLDTRSKSPIPVLQTPVSSKAKFGLDVNSVRPSLTPDSLAKLTMNSQNASSESIERYMSQPESFDKMTMQSIEKAAARIPIWEDPGLGTLSADSLRSGRARSAVSSHVGSQKTAASSGSKTSASSMAFSVMSKTSGILKPGRKGRRRFTKQVGSSSSIRRATHTLSPATSASLNITIDQLQHTAISSMQSLEQAMQNGNSNQDLKDTAQRLNPRYACTTCGKACRDRYEWRRHEAIHFEAGERWVCMPDNHSTGENKRCVFCGRPDSIFHGTQQFCARSKCLETELSERTFIRKDQLKQHFQHVHKLTKEQLKGPHLNRSIEAWRKQVPWAEANIAALWCGFCKTFLNDWNERLDHVTAHFKHGCDVESWRTVGWECEMFRHNWRFNFDPSTKQCPIFGCGAGQGDSSWRGIRMHMADEHNFGECGGVVYNNATDFREHLKEAHRVEFPWLNDLLREVALFDT